MIFLSHNGENLRKRNNGIAYRFVTVLLTVVTLIITSTSFTGCNKTNKNNVSNNDPKNIFIQEDVDNAGRIYGAYPLKINPLSRFLTYEYQKLLKSNDNKLIACKVSLHDIEELEGELYGIFYNANYGGVPELELRLRLNNEQFKKLETEIFKDETSKIMLPALQFIVICKINKGFKKENLDVLINGDELGETKRFVFEGDAVNFVFQQNDKIKK